MLVSLGSRGVLATRRGALPSSVPSPPGAEARLEPCEGSSTWATLPETHTSSLEDKMLMF